MSGTLAELTQLAAEQWGQGGPAQNTRPNTQVLSPSRPGLIGTASQPPATGSTMVSGIGTVTGASYALMLGTGPPAQLTQIAIEQWSSVATATPPAVTSLNTYILAPYRNGHLGVAFGSQASGTWQLANVGAVTGGASGPQGGGPSSPTTPQVPTTGTPNTHMLSATRFGLPSVSLLDDYGSSTWMVGDVGAVPSLTVVTPTGPSYVLTGTRAGYSAVVQQTTLKTPVLALPAVVAEAAAPAPPPGTGNLTGVAAAGVAGIVTVTVPVFPIAYPVGVFATGAVGTLTVTIIPPTLAPTVGVFATGVAGIVTVTIVVSRTDLLVGVAATGAVGGLTAYVGPVVFPDSVYAIGVAEPLFAIAGGVVEQFTFFMQGVW